MSSAKEKTPLIASSFHSRDHEREKSWTVSRKLAAYLSRYKWYNPQKDDPFAPSLAKAWEYWEHNTLPRYVPGRRSLQDPYPRANSGEKLPTRLYPVLKTPEKELGDFGVGIGVYFYTQKMLCIIFFIAGIMSIPNLMYFSSDTYGANENLSFFLESSAICNDRTWAACPTCSKDQLDYFPRSFDRYAETTTESGETLKFTLLNNCKITEQVGIVSYATMMFVIFAILVLERLCVAKERDLDLAAQTTSDYAIQVENPPADAKNVQEWKNFFDQFGQVTSITIALDNEELLKALRQRREAIFDLESRQPPERGEIDPNGQKWKDYIDSAAPLGLLQRLMGYKSVNDLEKHIDKLETLIETDLSKRNYDVCEVFVIFEEEKAQRHALGALSVRKLDIIKQNTSRLSKKYLFRRKHILDVVQPPEPPAVRWEDLDATFWQRLKSRFLADLATFLIICAAGGLVILTQNSYGVAYAAMVITTLNSLAPYICDLLVSYESHSDQNQRETSCYTKVTAWLWINTSIVTALITPFVDTLQDSSGSLIPAMYAIFITEMLKTPVLETIDYMGVFYRHVMAPRARDQKRMNAYFSGKLAPLYWKYTDLTSVMFLTFYYSLLFPAGYFFAAMTLAIHYWADKFCLLRNWAPSPMLGNKISDMSRKYFFSVAIMVFAIMTSFHFASFPFDNACATNENVPSEYVGTFQAKRGISGEMTTITIDSDSQVYYYCNQDMLQYKPFPAFPAIPSHQPRGGEWMTSEQTKFSYVYGWTSLVVLIIFVMLSLKYMISWGVDIFIRNRIVIDDNDCSTYKFSGIADRLGYVPQIKIAGFPYPTLFCNVNEIDPELIGWKPMDGSYEDNSALNDLASLQSSSQIKLFSSIAQWRPREA